MFEKTQSESFLDIGNSVVNVIRFFDLNVFVLN
jgi:hypothetical protein